jgi:polysaccharide pyruvyl transferase CsaB
LAHLLLAGYFGSGNLGDDAILLGFAHNLGPGFELTVMSGSPEETFRHHGLRSIPRKDFKAFDEALKSCDALVFPGGSIFQDVTSLKSIAYYGQLVKKAKAAGKKVFLLAQGVGPVTRFFGRRIAASSFACADVVTVRDPASAAALKELGVKTNPRVTADMAFLLQPPTNDEGENAFAVGNMTTVGLVPRAWGKDKKAVPKLFGDLAKLLFQANMMPVLIELDQSDDETILQISKMQGGKVPDIRKLRSPSQVQQRMSRMGAVISMRLHGGILAASVGVPSFMVSYDPKVTAFAKMLEMGSAPDINGLTAQRLFENFMAFHKDRERNLKILARKRDELTASARQNIEIVRESLSMAPQR